MESKGCILTKNYWIEKSWLGGSYELLGWRSWRKFCCKRNRFSTRRALFSAFWRCTCAFGCCTQSRWFNCGQGYFSCTKWWYPFLTYLGKVYAFLPIVTDTNFFAVIITFVILRLTEMKNLSKNLQRSDIFTNFKIAPYANCFW